ncbi:MAG: hypothetical protein R2781_10705 [Flavobacteriaceae bacterium]
MKNLPTILIKMVGNFYTVKIKGEISRSFDNILLENSWYEKVFCLDEQLIEKFKGYNLNFRKKKNLSFFFQDANHGI